jgi:hypothetical protein
MCTFRMYVEFKLYCTWMAVDAGQDARILLLIVKGKVFKRTVRGNAHAEGAPGPASRTQLLS